MIDARPLTEITEDALKVLYKELGVVDTLRFINQFTAGYGNYTEDREQLFADVTLDDLIAQIKQTRTS
ncbi:MAG: hypothetical protein KBE23_14815 [Chloroflexi bacterium]|nr:hypothetical protein [Chloroflexota bacterium]MBP7044016.1 hypothetical protein [Chloroflexota bacterium]